MRKRTTLYIDRELIEKAKKHGINISRFVEACLKKEIERLTMSESVRTIIDSLEAIENKIRKLLSLVLDPRLIPNESLKEIAMEHNIDDWRKILNKVKLMSKHETSGIRDPQTGHVINEDLLLSLIDLINFILDLPDLILVNKKTAHMLTKIVYNIDDEKKSLVKFFELAQIVRRYPEFFRKRTAQLLELIQTGNLHKELDE